jgi:hypothetical protein
VTHEVKPTDTMDPRRARASRRARAAANHTLVAHCPQVLFTRAAEIVEPNPGVVAEDRLPTAARMAANLPNPRTGAQWQ